METCPPLKFWRPFSFKKNVLEALNKGCTGHYLGADFSFLFLMAQIFFTSNFTCTWTVAELAVFHT